MQMQSLRLQHLLTAALLFAAAAVNAQSTGIEQFEWLTGNWKGPADKGDFYESWTRYDESTLTGEGYLIIENDTVFREVLRIQNICGHWVYIASINKGVPVLFALAASDDSKWVFENKEHDFPQRVVYSLKTDGSLLAWIEGEMKGKMRKEEYSMEKME